MKNVIKRLLDLTAASLLLVVLSPFLLATAIVVWASLGWPIFFRQQRVGKDERIFRLWKFRTMTLERDALGNLRADAERLTPAGVALRRWSLDELPQLLNVITGSMSIVGPRPLLIRYLPRYSRAQRRRHIVKPGLTGLAQISGRNSLGWEARFELDTFYADHWTIFMDIGIIIRTAVSIFRGAGSGARGGADLDEFWGTGAKPGERRPAEEVEK
jgi:lipopolysaccharide/colanic/teichoic acid biosynthesis glycosyltransferase